jgi:EAL domain-containing protein (putative c-di-GMP-specific phosphodiesterase class I)
MISEEFAIRDRFFCNNCSDVKDLGFSFSMAFQPMINCQTKKIFGYEALVRGIENESSFSILSKVNIDNRYLFDQRCRVKAIELASRLKLDSMLSINFLPNAIYQPELFMRATLEAAQKYKFPVERIMFELVESEKLEDYELVRKIINYYNEVGFATAIDDFGSGYSGLTLLADFQANIVKFDMGLIRNINRNNPRQVIVRNCLTMFRELGITPLAEGIESMDEMFWLREAGVELMQGYLFARPGFESLPSVDFSIF